VKDALPSLDTIVIGAGAAGLFAARELTRAGKRVVVLEARHRVGGRMHTELDSRIGLPIELGAEFVHGDAPVTTRLLDEARLATVPVLGRHYRSDHGELSPQGPIWERMGRVFAHMSRTRKEDRSLQDFLDEHPGGARLRDERELARGFVQGFDGADPSLISERSLAQQGNPTEGAAEARRIVNGYAALVVHLEREVAGLIRLETVARRVVWTAGDVRVIDATGAEHRARSVVVTVPLPILKEGLLRFDPPIPTIDSATRLLLMGHVLHVALVVRERFWEKKAKELRFVHTPTRPFTVWWTQHPLTVPLITGWTGGSPALALLREEKVEEAALAELAHAFGMRRARAEALVESMHWHDWSRDEHTRGAYSYAAVGGAHAPRTLARQTAGTVFLAGEATSLSSGGTVEGALESAARAVKSVLRALAD
jgi:monoamine oxidase